MVVRFSDRTINYWRTVMAARAMTGRFIDDQYIAAEPRCARHIHFVFACRACQTELAARKEVL